MQSFTTGPDVPLLVTLPSPNPADPPLISAERRISPSWTVGQLKDKLEPVAGIPPSWQTLMLKGVGEMAPNDKSVGEFRLVKGMEIEIQTPHTPSHLFPSSSTSSTQDSTYKFHLPSTAYASLPTSVLSWKKTAQLGRFNPSAPSPSQRAQTRHAKDAAAVTSRGIAVGLRCRVGESDERRGVVRYVGDVPEIKGRKLPPKELEREREIEEDEGEEKEEVFYEESGAIWVGVEFDEPVGRNDGSVEIDVDAGAEAEGEEGERAKKKKKRYFICRGLGHGSFVRPERVEVGEQFGPLGLGGEDSDMEEL